MLGDHLGSASPAPTEGNPSWARLAVPCAPAVPARRPTWQRMKRFPGRGDRSSSAPTRKCEGPGLEGGSGLTSFPGWVGPGHGDLGDPDTVLVLT